MKFRPVINVIAALVVIIGLAILFSTGVSWYMGDSNKQVMGLFLSAMISIGFGISTFLLSRVNRYTLGIREGFGIVTLGWITASAFGAIPYIIVSDFFWYDAFFETMSGFSTTGSSVMDNQLLLMSGETLKTGIRDMSKGILFWRSLTHWFGGMGIVVLSLAILPFLGISGQKLYNAEVPGPTSDQLTPRIANSAKILWGVYFLLTIIQVLFLWFGGMPMFDSWCHSFATLATGGFSTQQASIGHYGSAYFDTVITVFMFLAGCNFILHYRALQGKPLFYFKDEEFRFYLGVVLISTATITLNLILSGKNILDSAGNEIVPTFFNALQYASFQVVSIITTTGFATADWDLWPAYSAILLVSLMFIGGCGGSTGGGMKSSRILLLIKYGKFQVERCLYPSVVANVRLNKERIDTSTLYKTLSFFFFFLIIYIICTILLCVVDDIDFRTATTASIAALGNIGPGLGKVGATCSYSWFSPAAKLLLTFEMLLGRLELYTVLVLFLPSFWKK